MKYEIKVQPGFPPINSAVGGWDDGDGEYQPIGDLYGVMRDEVCVRCFGSMGEAEQFLAGLLMDQAKRAVGVKMMRYAPGNQERVFVAASALADRWSGVLKIIQKRRLEYRGW